MIIRKDELLPNKREQMRGGNGSAVLYKVAQDKMPANWRLGAVIEIAPHSSIGEHIHEGECEMFFFLDAAKVLDNGESLDVQPGDFMFTPNGHGHSVINDADSPVRLLAVIVQD